MSELRKRLRAWAVEKRNQEPKIRGYDGATAGLCEEAADRLEAAETLLRRLRNVIANLPEDALGTDAIGDPEVPGGFSSWPIRDELLHGIDTFLNGGDS